MHDWWFGLIAAGLGKIGYVEGFTEYYRQHENNVVGGENFTSYFKARISKMQENRMRIRENIAQGEGFLKYFGEYLCEPELSAVKEFAALKTKGYLGRRISIIKNRFLTSGLVRNIALFIFV